MENLNFEIPKINGNWLQKKKIHALNERWLLLGNEAKRAIIKTHSKKIRRKLRNILRVFFTFILNINIF